MRTGLGVASGFLAAAGQQWLAVGLQLIGGILGGLTRRTPKRQRTSQEIFFDDTVAFYRNLGKKYGALNNMSMALTGNKVAIPNTGELMDRFPHKAEVAS